MNNFSRIGLIVMLMFTTITTYGQRPGMEKIKTLKVAFITERLDLTSKEAQVFWPIYNQHEDDIEEMKRRERVEIRAKLMDFESLSNSEAAALLQQMIALEKKKQQLHIAFIEKMSDVISPKKTFLLIKAEEDFKKRLLRQIQQRNKGGGR
ncbi:MAG: hypothetical protein KJN76_13995 [Eudoraea sp.]|nr:hypothetical protein [Eudoraea sp.]